MGRLVLCLFPFIDLDGQQRSQGVPDCFLTRNAGILQTGAVLRLRPVRNRSIHARASGCGGYARLRALPPPVLAYASPVLIRGTSGGVQFASTLHSPFPIKLVSCMMSYIDDAVRQKGVFCVH